MHGSTCKTRCQLQYKHKRASTSKSHIASACYEKEKNIVNDSSRIEQQWNIHNEHASSFFQRICTAKFEQGDCLNYKKDTRVHSCAAKWLRNVGCREVYRKHRVCPGNFGTVFVEQSYWQCGVAAKPRQGVIGFLAGGLTWFSVPFVFATTMGLAYLALGEINGSPLLTAGDVDRGMTLYYSLIIDRSSLFCIKITLKILPDHSTWSSDNRTCGRLWAAYWRIKATIKWPMHTVCCRFFRMFLNASTYQFAIPTCVRICRGQSMPKINPEAFDFRIMSLD
jgi:hypothetical protein